MEEDFDDTTMDACLIAAGQRAEHYEMAAYGTLVAWAQAMGHTEAAKLLQQTLDEEKAADKKLSGLAEGGINQSAADAAHPDEEEEETVGWRERWSERVFDRENGPPLAVSSVERVMVLIQLLLPTPGAAGSDAMTPLAETRRELADSFSFALRAELKDTGVTVTCLVPGATETDFFERAEMLDTQVGQGKKDDPADVARVGLDGMMRGDGDVVSGWKNKLQSAIANITPAGVLAEQHRKMAEAGSAQKAKD